MTELLHERILHSLISILRDNPENACHGRRFRNAIGHAEVPHIQIFRYELRIMKTNKPITVVMRCIVSKDIGITTRGLKNVII